MNFYGVIEIICKFQCPNYNRNPTFAPHTIKVVKIRLIFRNIENVFKNILPIPPKLYELKRKMLFFCFQPLNYILFASTYPQAQDH